jgi:Fur family transcriptional regulator, ferric uptake regulator
MPKECDGVYGAGRSTAQRRAVAAAVARFGGAFTAGDLATRVRCDTPAVSTATVYRSIAAMAASGHLAPVGERDGAVLYARCEEPGHHHHVVCTRCGATTHAPCPVEPALTAAAPDGFIVTSHEVRLYGLCAACGDRERTADGCSCDAEPAAERG